MSVRYKKVMGKGVGSPVANKWYGRAVSMGRVKTADLAEEISHSTTVTRADIMAVLIELTQVMKKHLQNSMTVELDGLGDFRVGLKTKVADKAEDFTAANIYGYQILYHPEVRFVASGKVGDKGKRKGTYVKTMLDGVSAQLFPSSTAASDANTKTPEGNA